MERYNFKIVEKKWQEFWAKDKTFQVFEDKNKEKFYVLDMFPYPSGSGLHVGHPLGYIASDIYARYKKHKGFNVLHPMGYDSFGLPTEQYAIETGIHPKTATEKNSNRYREQLDKLGFSFDWSREIKTSNPDYYKWTQWIFKQLFNSYYCNLEDKALPITKLIKEFERNGNSAVNVKSSDSTASFSSSEWLDFSYETKQEILLSYRLAYLSESMVNWCPELGTVLANDEVKEGRSERGGFLVEQKKMKQWSLRITAYADRLNEDLNQLDWSDSLKEMQRNWIGKSKGVTMGFSTENNELIVLVGVKDFLISSKFVSRIFAQVALEKDVKRVYIDLFQKEVRFISGPLRFILKSLKGSMSLLKTVSWQRNKETKCALGLS